MKIQPPNYEEIEQELWRKHGKEVRFLLATGDSGLLRRVQTFCQRFDFNESDVNQKIRDDFMFACCFAKDAVKTGFHQKEAEKYLRMFPNLIRVFRSLPASGKHAKYIDQMGNIITG